MAIEETTDEAAAPRRAEGRWRAFCRAMRQQAGSAPRDAGTPRGGAARAGRALAPLRPCAGPDDALIISGTPKGAPGHAPEVDPLEEVLSAPLRTARTDIGDLDVDYEFGLPGLVGDLPLAEATEQLAQGAGGAVEPARP